MVQKTMHTIAQKNKRVLVINIKSQDKHLTWRIVMDVTFN